MICCFDLFCNDVLSIAKLSGMDQVKASHLCVTHMVYSFFWVLEGIITSRYDSEGQPELEGNDFSEEGMKWEVVCFSLVFPPLV